VQYALPVELKPRFHSNRLAKDRFIAEIVSKPGEATTDKMTSLQGSVFTDPFLFGCEKNTRRQRLLA